MIEGNDVDETEIAKCAPISDEIDSQDTGSHESEDRSLKSDEESDETTEGNDGLKTKP